ncbi:C40 family peptidase, partial [Christensenella minuta]|uniref:C40 family peptidase n=1 Tax=Christensenella minuta TaxID=626937 RepID=UPI00215871D4
LYNYLLCCVFFPCHLHSPSSLVYHHSTNFGTGSRIGGHATYINTLIVEKIFLFVYNVCNYKKSGVRWAMKKIISLLIISIILIVFVVGCSENNQQKSAEPTGTVISNSEQQDTESTSTVTPSTSISPTPSASPSVSPSPSPTATTSKSNNGVNGKNGKNGRDGQDGADGQNGADGSDGQTPYIGSNGNWWIDNQDTGVSATGQGTSGSAGTPIADIAVGTKFPCYPNQAFDWGTRYGDKNNVLHEATLHITSISVELIDKKIDDKGWLEWAANPNKTNGSEGFYEYSPYTYTIEVSVTGYTDKVLAGFDVVAGANGIVGYSKINDDGSFSTIGAATFYSETVPNFVFNFGSVYPDFSQPEPTPTPSPTPTAPPNPGDVEAFVTKALEQVGKPYALGGKSPDVGFDCSGLIYYALKESGNNVGYMTSGGWASSSFPTIGWDDLQRGDIVCLSGHTAIYLGNNMVVDASSSAGQVVMRDMGTYFKNMFICGKRPLIENGIAEQSSVDSEAEATLTPSIPVPSPSQAPIAKETATESPTPSATGTGNTETP